MNNSGLGSHDLSELNDPGPPAEAADAGFGPAQSALAFGHDRSRGLALAHEATTQAQRSNHERQCQYSFLHHILPRLCRGRRPFYPTGVIVHERHSAYDSRPRNAPSQPEPLSLLPPALPPARRRNRTVWRGLVALGFFVLTASALALPAVGSVELSPGSGSERHLGTTCWSKTVRLLADDNMRQRLCPQPKVRSSSNLCGRIRTRAGDPMGTGFWSMAPMMR